MKYAAININFDSLGEAYGFPENYRDPTFFEISERFFKLADKYNFKFSIFVIGKDLEKTENRRAVELWSSQGHEIGNHSWSHPVNLGSMRKDEISREVEMAHEIITKTIGKEPKGFIAPGWSASRDLTEVLINLNYSYDTSIFPSWLIYPSLLKMLINHLGDRRLFKILNRKDYLCPLFSPRDIFWSDGSLYKKKSAKKINDICMMPLPCNKFRLAIWHTLVFIFGWTIHAKILRSCLKEINAFYYLIHPADLICNDDLDLSKRCHLERMDTSLEVKIRYLERAIEMILESGRQIILMKDLFEKVSSNRDDDSNGFRIS